jgi:hypothetical protein
VESASIYGFVCVPSYVFTGTAKEDLLSNWTLHI